MSLNWKESLDLILPEGHCFRENSFPVGLGGFVFAVSMQQESSLFFGAGTFSFVKNLRMVLAWKLKILKKLEKLTLRTLKTKYSSKVDISFQNMLVSGCKKG